MTSTLAKFSQRALRRGLAYSWEAGFSTLMFCALLVALLTAEPDAEPEPPDAAPVQCSATSSG